MENENRKQKGHEAALFFIALAVLAAVVGAVFVNKKVVHELELKEIQVSSLIEEVGKVREENQHLSEKLKNNDVNFEALARMVRERGIPRPNISEEKVAIPKVQKISKQENSIKIPVILALAPEENPQISTDEPDPFFDVLIVGVRSRLTDAIMVARFDEANQKIILISIPRDLSVSGRKINEYYQLYGIGELMKQAQKATGITIDYSVVIHMPAFADIIDALSGIDILVEKDLYDAFFPTADGSSQVFSISKGWHHFNGAEALKYARSRKSTSDFDRAKRQQTIIQAVRDKIFTMRFLLDLEKAKNVFQEIFKLLETDIGFLDGLAFMQKYASYQIQTGEVLSTANFLYSTTNTGGQYILLPKGKNFSAIHQHIQNLTAD